MSFEVHARDGDARSGTITTTHGSFRTPAFMPVGTRGSVRGLAADELERVGAEVMLANAYHLMLRPGADVVRDLGGIHGFASWRRPALTDSGGYQVFSLGPDVDDDGVTFRSTYDGSSHRLTPERAVAVQEALGADIQMVLDVCPPWPCGEVRLRDAVARTAAWAARAKAAHRRGDQQLFGIVQGGTDIALRVESAARTVELEFDGYAVGGLSVGEPAEELLTALAATTPCLPADKPRYLMGVGDPVGLVEAVALGVDLFDCVLPTRLARHGTVLTATGRLALRNARHAVDEAPLDPDCACDTCARYSRAYLRHILRAADPAAARLLTAHNLTWLLGLVGRARSAIEQGTLSALRREVAAVWRPEATRPPR